MGCHHINYGGLCLRQRLQQPAMDLGPEIASEVILAIEVLDVVTSNRLGHALYLVASSFSSLSEKKRKEAVNRSLWLNKLTSGYAHGSHLTGKMGDHFPVREF